MLSVLFSLYTVQYIYQYDSHQPVQKGSDASLILPLLTLMISALHFHQC